MRTLEKVIKNAIAADKYKSGVKEVLQSVKGSKLIIVSKSIDPEYRKKLEDQARSSNQERDSRRNKRHSIRKKGQVIQKVPVRYKLSCENDLLLLPSPLSFALYLRIGTL
jgi:hypothetical protein